jgi:hypothetical protein
MFDVVKGNKIPLDKWADAIKNEYVDKGFEGKLDRPLADFWGRVHKALKLPAAMGEFARSQVMRTQAKALEYARNGMSPKEALAKASSPEMQHEIGILAYIDSQKAVLLGNNKLYEGIEKMLRAGRTSSDPLIRGAAHTAEILQPIRKVGTNLLLEAKEHAIGGFTAANILKRGVASLSTEDRDLVLRNLSKQTIGAVLGYLFVQGYLSAGGHYTGDKRDYQEKLKPGQISVGGHTLGAGFTHSAALEIGQMIGDYNKFRGRGSSVAGAIGKAVGTEAKQNIAMLQLLDDLHKMFLSGSEREQEFERSKFVNRQAKRVVPALVQDVAKGIDAYQNPGVTGRQARTPAQSIQSVLPFVNQKLPPYKD